MKKLLTITILLASAIWSKGQTPTVRVTPTTVLSAPLVYTQAAVDTLVNRLSRRITALETTVNNMATIQRLMRQTDSAIIAGMVQIDTTKSFTVVAGVLVTRQQPIDLTPITTQLSGISGRLTATEGSIAGLQSQSVSNEARIGALQGRATKCEGDITGINTRLATLIRLLQSINF